MERDRTVNNGRFTVENASRMQAKGVSVRRERAALRKDARIFAEAALNANVTDKSSGKKIVVKEAIIQRLVARAIQEADLQTIKYLFELIGEGPSQKLEITGKDGGRLFNEEPLSRKEAAEMLNRFELEL